MQREYKISLSQEYYSDVVYLSQYDDDYDVIFHVINKYSAADVGGKSAKFTGTRTDGLGFTFNAVAVGSSVAFHINTSLTACAGTHTAEIVFYDSNDLYFGSANVQVIVEKAAHPEGTIDADEEQLRELAEQVQEIVDTAAAEVKGEAESWAVGERDGVPVPSTDPTYQNNAKYYAESIAGVTEQVATNTSDISELKEDLNFIADYKGNTTGADYSPWESGKTLNAEGKIGSSGYYSACPTFIHVPEFVTTLRFVTGDDYGAIVCRYSSPNEVDFVDRVTYTPNHGYDLDVSVYKYIRFAVGSTDISNVGTVGITASYPLKTKIDGLDTDVSHLLLKAFSTDNADANSIQPNTNYDDLTVSGNYYCSSSANAQSMTHCPVNVAHRLIVMTTTSANRIWQIVIPNANTDIYIRTNIGSWNEWNKIITSRNGVESYDVRITSSNYQTILPDLDEAQVNIVYSIAPNTPIPNIPEGNYNVAGADQSYGVASGTLVTLRGAKMGSGYEKFQLFMSAAGVPEGGIGSIINFRGCRYSGGTLVWDKWSKMGNGVNLRATNTFIQESRIQAGTAMFSDMNDAPNNTIVQIDLDAVSMANNPLTGHSCVLITLCPSYISRHGMLQLCSGITGGSTLLYFRYGYQQSVGNIVWMPWKQVMPITDGEPLLNKGRLANDSDFNDVAGNSIYMLGASGNYGNNPIDTQVGFLTTKAVDTIMMQTCERLNGDTYTRYTTDGGSTWSNWTQH